MSFRVIEGNIFTSRCQTLVNTVNCVGVMGAGIALEYRLRYPEMYQRYAAFCSQGKIDVGKLWLYRTPARWVLNFPTKKHWRYPTRESYIRLGLEKLVASYRQKGITSLAMPLLGADRGGIEADVSLAMIREYLDTGLEGLDIEVYRYDPMAKDDLFDDVKAQLLSTSPAVIMNETGITSQPLKKLLEALQQDDIYQLNQLLRVKGVGLVTLEKAFQLSQTLSTTSPATTSPDLFG